MVTISRASKMEYDLPRLTLRQLEYLISVGETGSIARASEALNVSSPSISAAISQLEEELGFSLFVRRHAQGLSQTPGGRKVITQAKRVIEEVAEIADIAADVSGAARGPLSVGCLVTFAQLVLPRMRVGFESAYPDINVRQSELNQAEIFSALRRSEIDIAITYDMDIPADLQFTSLVKLRPFVLLAASHAYATKSQIAISDLLDLPMVLLDLPISTDYFLSLFSNVQATPRVVERTRDMAVMRSLVGNDFGYSIANVHPQNSISPDGLPLAAVPIKDPVRSLRMGLLTAQGADKSRTVKAFLDFSKEQAKSGAFEPIGGEVLK